MEYRRTIIDQRVSDNDPVNRDIPSFIEPLPPLISNPFMRPKPVKGTNLLELFEEDSEYDEPELVQVYLRLKPCNIPCNLYEVRSNQCLITSMDTATAGHGRRTQHNVSKAYTFTKIFGPDANQKEIFETVVKDNLRKLADGQSYTLLTYGASGSGKTYTLMGTVQSPGLVPRSLEYVFRVVDSAQQPLCKPSENGAEKLSYAQQAYELQWVKRLRQVSAPLRDKYRRMSAQLKSDFSASTADLTDKTRYYVWVSFIEIYNEAIYDLLVTGDRRAASKLRIREDSTGQVYVKGATQAFVRSGEEAYDVLVAGKHNLQVAATGVHAHSSRSHCIFTITLLTETDDGDMRVSCVRLCDLAGSERQANTRNAGARMAESRAINSSLHVLERCLHMLRRRRKPGANPGLVPYRESKLTRLLGTGLSGARGEAVSMVVAVNPDPARAHETRHVLQLAAVARDIQVNSTIAECTLEESEQDSTIAPSADVMRLRADNERLHFELMQAQSRIKELLCTMEEKQQTTASTMRELVEEAKEISKQYYEAQMAAIERRFRTEIEDLIEEYEIKLRAKSTPHKTGTPSRQSQSMITQLSTEITILEERLCAEELARARAEREVEHLRACIDERDHEKCSDDNLTEENGVVLLSDEEQSEDEMNESLEPSFRKEGLNATALERQCSEHDSSNDTDTTAPDTTLDNTARSTTHTSFEQSNETKDETGSNNTLDVTNKDSDSFKQPIDMKRSTYYIANDIEDSTDSGCSISKTNRNSKDADESKNSSLVGETVNVPLEGKTVGKATKDIISKFKTTDPVDKSVVSNESLAVFEELEKQSDDAKKVQDQRSVELIHVNVLKEKRTYFNEDSGDMAKETSDKEIVLKAATSENKKSYFDASEDGKSGTSEKDSGGILAFSKPKKTYFDVDSNKPQTSTKVVSKDTSKDPKNKRYFDDDTVTTEPSLEVEILKEKRTYFDNLSDNLDKIQKDDKNHSCSKVDDVRSPSIVKDDVPKNYEPTTIKKLLGDSFTTNVSLSAAKTKLASHVHDSFDIFEEVNSPKLAESEDSVCFEKIQKCLKKFSIVDESATKETTKADETMEKFIEPVYSVERINIKEMSATETVTKSTEVISKSTRSDRTDINKAIDIETAKLESGKTTNDTTVEISIEACKNMYKTITVATVIDESTATESAAQIDTNKKPTGVIRKSTKSEKNYINEEIDIQTEKLESRKKNTTDTTVEISIEACKRNYKNIIPPNATHERSMTESDNKTKPTGAISKLITSDKIDINDAIDIQTEKIESGKKDISETTVEISIDPYKSMSKIITSATTKLKRSDKIDINEAIDIQTEKLESGKKNTSDSTVEISIDACKSMSKIITTPAITDESAVIGAATKTDKAKQTGAVPKLKRSNQIDINEAIDVQTEKLENYKDTTNTTVENTIDAFENIYKDITAPRVTEFELLATQVVPEISFKEVELASSETSAANYNRRQITKQAKTDGGETTENVESNDVANSRKYYLRRREEDAQPSKSTVKSSRSLRLRRRKNLEEEPLENEKDAEKLKDIANLQREFADVIANGPAVEKKVDVESPEKNCEDEENVVPGMQSCPSKSVSRSRRKLFTPRAEPLEESLNTGDSNERLCVPRPSYHRGRARRKL